MVCSVRERVVTAPCIKSCITSSLILPACVPLSALYVLRYHHSREGGVLCIQSAHVSAKSARENHFNAAHTGILTSLRPLHSRDRSTKYGRLSRGKKREIRREFIDLWFLNYQHVYYLSLYNLLWGEQISAFCILQ